MSKTLFILNDPPYEAERSDSALVAALRLAARGDLDGPAVTVLPDSWDRYRAKSWMQEWAT
jgi:hypothetical protein